MPRIHYICILALSLITAPQPASVAAEKKVQAKYAVIVHLENKAPLTEQDISRIFLGKVKTFPKGGKAVPLMQGTMTEVGKAFLKRFLHKRPYQYKSYWMNMIFTGEGNPPQEISDESTLLEHVAGNRHAIGIVERSSVDKRVRVIAQF